MQRAFNKERPGIAERSWKADEVPDLAPKPTIEY
jgi:hypothetical protein